MKKVSVFVFLLPLSVLAQNKPDGDRQDAFDQIIELVSENLETEDLDFTTYLEDLNYYFEHPLNLNRANREQLERLLILDAFQIDAFFRHVERTGRLMTLYELQGIEGFDAVTIRALLPFVEVSDASNRPAFTASALKNEGTHEYFIRYQRVLEEMEGYAPISDSALAASPNSRYLGDPTRIYTRYRYRFLNNLSLGITGEKDAGEAFFRAGQSKGFDFYSAHLYLGHYGVVKHAVVGDYQAQFGQGLTFWSGLAFGKSASVASIKRTAREITPFVSAMENTFLRGAATTLQFGSVETTVFYSRKRIDANLVVSDSSVVDGEFVSEFSSLQNSGFHRTPGELEDKDAVVETNSGAHVRLSKDRFQVGGTVAYTAYSGNYQPAEALYRKFEPTSSSFLVAGIDYQYMVRNVLGFGEFSQRFDGGSAFVNGAIISLDPRFDVAVLHRFFSPYYANPYSNAVGENSRNNNEQGLYIGFSSRLSAKWSFNGYYDLFTFPWLRFQVDAPSKGQEYLCQLEYRPSRNFAAYARYRFEHKTDGYESIGQSTSAIGMRERQWYRLNMQWTLNKVFTLRSRLEYVRVVNPDEENGAYKPEVLGGWLIYQDVVWKPQWPARYQVKMRYALFDTDGYDSRIYAYEHDVLYSFSVPAYYNRGTRLYLVLQYDLSRWADLSVRFAQTYFAGQSENGSGLNTVSGPTRSEVKAQLRVRL